MPLSRSVTFSVENGVWRRGRSTKNGGQSWSLHAWLPARLVNLLQDRCTGLRSHAWLVARQIYGSCKCSLVASNRPSKYGETWLTYSVVNKLFTSIYGFTDRWSLVTLADVIRKRRSESSDVKEIVDCTLTQNIFCPNFTSSFVPSESFLCDALWVVFSSSATSSVNKK